MSMQDSISDMFTCIRNAQKAKKNKIIIYYTKFKYSILKVIYSEGYIKKYNIFFDVLKKKKIVIYLKYYDNKPVISNIKRISKPSLRIYKSYKKLPLFMSGLGIIIISTSKGVLSDKQARILNVGGELIGSIF